MQDKHIVVIGSRRGLYLQILLNKLESECINHQHYCVTDLYVPEPLTLKKFMISSLLGLNLTNDWICKGKHQYREVKGENIKSSWVCQCGRSL